MVAVTRAVSRGRGRDRARRGLLVAARAGDGAARGVAAGRAPDRRRPTSTSPTGSRRSSTSPTASPSCATAAAWPPPTSPTSTHDQLVLVDPRRRARGGHAARRASSATSRCGSTGPVVVRRPRGRDPRRLRPDRLGLARRRPRARRRDNSRRLGRHSMVRGCRSATRTPSPGPACLRARGPRPRGRGARPRRAREPLPRAAGRGASGPPRRSSSRASTCARATRSSGRSRRSAAAISRR